MLEATKFLISPDLEDAKQLKGNTAFKNYHNHAKALAEKFLASPAHILLKEVHGQEICKRRNELISILKRYRELSFQLWYRVVEVKCYYLGSDLVPSTFDPASPAMELYTALEEDATGIESHKHKNLTGLRVMVIMKPAIVAHWVDQEDNKLERSKVWVKSVAWVYAREGSKESESQQGIVGKESNEHQETMGICEKNEEELPLNTDLGEENHEPQQVIGEDSDDEHEHDMDIDEECQEHQQEITTLDEKSNEPQQCIYEEREAEHQQEMDIDEKCPKTKKDMIEEIGETKTMSDKRHKKLNRMVPFRQLRNLIQIVPQVDHYLHLSTLPSTLLHSLTRHLHLNIYIELFLSFFYSFNHFFFSLFFPPLLSHRFSHYHGPHLMNEPPSSQLSLDKKGENAQKKE